MKTWNGISVQRIRCCFDKIQQYFNFKESHVGNWIPLLFFKSMWCPVFLAISHGSKSWNYMGTVFTGFRTCVKMFMVLFWLGHWDVFLSRFPWGIVECSQLVKMRNRNPSQLDALDTAAVQRDWMTLLIMVGHPLSLPYYCLSWIHSLNNVAVGRRCVKNILDGYSSFQLKRKKNYTKVAQTLKRWMKNEILSLAWLRSLKYLLWEWHTNVHTCIYDS